ncbi:MAG: DUF899 domain-containing protein [Gammaproteobacteria bacterium]|nr:MAG: DUF899 domain-containing protein [Gammaproteobacteria bacterium]
MTNEAVRELEQEIFELTTRLRALRKELPDEEVRNYSFATLEGEVTLLDLFAGKDQLLAIHNMGQGCRYCTLWADGISPFLPHLESMLSVVLVSKDDPETQRRFANSRNWRFRMASHGGGDYIKEQSVTEGEGNTPGVVSYHLRDGKIFRQSASAFGPGDLYCSIWHLLGVAGVESDDWMPQYSYWKRPKQMDDGGRNLAE